ncbi:MAG: antibiotic biosynthesis monooxygenase [Phycisphaerales bacterium]|nr:MAG: antibiotic biosynthesis monooxygenase [Phycisphaerales bacterium]
MITVGMNYDIIPGREAEFEQVFSKVLGVMGRMPGHSHTELYRSVGRPNCYLIHSEWSDQAAFDAFIASEQFRNVADWGKREILAGRPRHEIYAAARPASAPPPTGGGKCPVGH